MSRITRAGITAGVAVTLACASLTGSATASSPSKSLAPKSAAPKIAATSVSQYGANPDRTFNPADRVQALSAARTQSASVARSLGLSKAQDLRATDVVRDADGTLHVRYSRTLRGLPVMGGDFVIHRSPTGAIQGADFASDNPLTLRTKVTTAISAPRAASLAAKSAGAAVTTVRTPQKVVWAVSGIPRLAWLTHVRGHDSKGFPMPKAVVVDARTGKRIQSWDLHETAKGHGRSLYSGRVVLITTRQNGKFILKDGSRGGSTTVDVHNKVDGQQFLKGDIFKDPDNNWGNGLASNRQTAAVDAAYGAAKTWDFYKQTFHRRGIRDNGKGAKSRVHYAKKYDNAFWSDGCFCMTYGDGGQSFKPLVSLDVAGHEMSHGVTSRTAGLYYFGDSGGLNEATSDIFGSMVEFFAKNKNDKGDYFIGEKIMKPGQGNFLRRMDNPKLDGVSFNCWSKQMGLADVHFTSGPANHFFYMLAEGSGPKKIGGLQHNSPVCPGADPVNGIGRTKAGKIWYRALTRYFLSTTGYIDARDATIHAAIDLYGLNSGECRQVVKAWNAANVPQQAYTCDGKLPVGANSFDPSPGFEIPNASWTPTGAGALIDNGQFSIPRRGQRNGLLNSFGQESDGSLSHTITVPNTATATLRFYMLISIASTATGELTSGTGTVDVFFGPTNVGHWDETYANNTYQRWDIDLSAFAGQTGQLSIVGHEDDPSLPGGIFAVFLDDFALTPM